MADKYLDFVSGGFGKTLAKQLGLPSPVKLRRFRPGAPLVEGPVLVISDDASRPSADDLASALLAWDLDVRRAAHLAKEDRWGAVVVVTTEASHPGDLSGVALETGSTLRQLTRSGRVVTVSRATAEGDAPAVAAVRDGIEGFVRSLGKELRAGATANGIVLG
ncbi:MAG: 3-oxoacyl-ACP reductase, partial [bacterium]|nr:3-oxoacyl-ACP reductase [bacterium]